MVLLSHSSSGHLHSSPPCLSQTPGRRAPSANSCFPQRAENIPPGCGGQDLITVLASSRPAYAWHTDLKSNAHVEQTNLLCIYLSPQAHDAGLLLPITQMEELSSRGDEGLCQMPAPKRPNCICNPAPSDCKPVLWGLHPASSYFDTSPAVFSSPAPWESHCPSLRHTCTLKPYSPPRFISVHH